MEFPHPHDQFNIRGTILDILDDFSLQDKANAITTDNAKNMIAAVNELKTNSSFLCF